VVANARAFYTPRAAAGATGTRLSLRPLFFEAKDLHNSGASRRGIVKLYLTVIASEAKQSI
jgi:hypothetical protein